MPSIVISLSGFIFVIFSVGSLAALFLFLLAQSVVLFRENSFLIFFLPLLGLLTGITYWYFGKKLLNTRRILHDLGPEGESPQPLRTAAFIFVFTILSQVFGASTGRESTAVQFGAALGDFWRNLFHQKLKPLRFHRQAFLRAGLAAGFGSVFGVPWAGALFAVEVTPSHRWPWRYLPLCCVSSFGAHWVALWWGAQHKAYPAFPALSWDLLLFAQWTCLGVAFGIITKIFLTLFDFFEKALFGKVPWPWLRPALGGILVLLLTLCFQDHRYNGLGVNLINAALENQALSWDFAWKGLFTILSSASGLRGGEVTPLMAVGASFGAVIAAWISLPALYAAALGVVAVFASASHIPWTGAVMAWELFGFEAFLPAFVVTFLATRVLGVQGLFARDQSLKNFR